MKTTTSSVPERARSLAAAAQGARGRCIALAPMRFDRRQVGTGELAVPELRATEARSVELVSGERLRDANALPGVLELAHAEVRTRGGRVVRLDGADWGVAVADLLVEHEPLPSRGR